MYCLYEDYFFTKYFRGFKSGRSESLRSLSPIRTVRESFPSYGSSRLKQVVEPAVVIVVLFNSFCYSGLMSVNVFLNLRPIDIVPDYCFIQRCLLSGHWPSLVHGFSNSFHKKTTMTEVCNLSVRDKSRIPINPVTGMPSLSLSFLCPLSRCSPLRRFYLIQRSS